MDPAVNYVVLLVLTLVTALNLILILRVASRIEVGAAGRASAPALVVGQSVPEFAGRALADSSPVRSEHLLGQPQVLIFLSSACPKCRASIDELVSLLGAIRGAGVGLWIVGVGPADDFARLLEGSPLLDHVLEMDEPSRRRLNPLNAAPMYVFLDPDLTTVAASYVGDDDWLSFAQQMREGADQAPGPL